MSHQLEKYRDYYLENDRVIFTASFHVKRGSCCGNFCRNCPFTKPHRRNNQNVAPEYKHLIEKKQKNMPLCIYVFENKIH
jgi:hypothetical protein